MAQARTERVQRTPVSGYRSVLTYSNKEPGYVYRFVNDYEGRIQVFLNAGYELVPTGEGQVGDKRVGTATDMGTIVSRPAGGGITSYLMRIKQEWYDEDQQVKLAHIKQMEQDMADQKGSFVNGYGKVSF